MNPVMTLQHARAVRHNPLAQRWELQQALEVLDRELERTEAHALDHARQTFLHGTPAVSWSNTVAS